MHITFFNPQNCLVSCSVAQLCLFVTLCKWVSLRASLVAPWDSGDTEDAGLIPGLGDPLEEEMVTHSTILVWKIPWTEEHDGLQSMGLQIVRHS